MQLKSCFNIFFLLSVILCRAQSDSLAAIKPFNSFSLVYDNDFFSATDRYYTQGTHLRLTLAAFEKWPLFRLLPALSQGRAYSLSLQQDVFTPRSIRYKQGAVYEGERPFTATLLLRHQRRSLSVEKKLLLYSFFDLGILGPAAFGAETQMGIHKALGNIAPQGWNNQLKTDAIVNYSARLEKFLVNHPLIDLSVFGAGRLGTLYSDADAGVQCRFGWLDGTFNESLRSNFSLCILFRGWGRAVGYNGTLQGGLFSSGNIYELPDSQVNRWLAQSKIGVLFRFRRVELEYSRYFISPEFREGLAHSWGRCGLSVLF